MTTDSLIAEAQRGDATALAAVMATGGDAAVRRCGVGGSDVAAILGLDPYRRPIDVWHEKRGTDDGPDDDTDATRWGRALEPLIAAEYERRHRLALAGPYGPQFHPDRPWHRYTLDRAVVAGNEIVRVVEIKARGFWRLRDYGAEGTDHVPAPELLQCLWYLAGTGCARADVIALFNTHQVREFAVERDRELESDVLDRVDAWWTRHIVGGVEPPPDGSDSFARHLRRRFPAAVGTYMTADAAIERDVAKLRLIDAVGRRLHETRELLRQRLQLAIGEHDGIDLPEGRLTWRPQVGAVRNAAVIDELARRLDIGPAQLRAIRDQYRTPSYRVFRTPVAWRNDTPEVADAALASLLE